ncbi:MAG: hypothetical protein K0R54_797 [Clostridiaceae bacterium]|jgi:hypothetical protein|nr:hypothetical protein [Clostridiaceae bacterium]
MIYVCEGTDKEKLEWFKIINIAGEKLTNQELRNAVYTGEWLTDAKKYFNKNSCPAYAIAKDYMNGSPIRQDYLETAIKWIAYKDGIEIEEYMADNQSDKDATELWNYFKKVINWIELIFTNRRKEMKGIDWGKYYNTYKDKDFNQNDIEKEIVNLMQDEDVSNKKAFMNML